MDPVINPIMTLFAGIIAQPGGWSPARLFVDTDSFNKLFQAGSLDILLRTGRQVIFTEEVINEIGNHPISAIALARKDWIDNHIASGTASARTAASQGRLLLTGSDAGETSIRNLSVVECFETVSGVT